MSGKRSSQKLDIKPIQKVFRLVSSSITVRAEGNTVGGLLLNGWEAEIPWNGGQTFSAHGIVQRVASAVERQASTHLLCRQ